MTVGIENINRVPSRVIKIVLDLDDPFGPELTLEDFIRYYKEMPQPPKYKIVCIEIVTCTEDNQPVLITECGQCDRFIRKFDGEIYCKGFSS
ncbi:MAG: hypothetical protein O2U61_04060 [Candidatus Bathyarchaeota archaeon]|nr:hypothetical protein [Candidatus Bathyarchaeota archaeon]MCZ2845657.1 hypothetical protein [Candidatus Bathyarchaeota archaeon]